MDADSKMLSPPDDFQFHGYVIPTPCASLPHQIGLAAGLWRLLRYLIMPVQCDPATRSPSRAAVGGCPAGSGLCVISPNTTCQTAAKPEGKRVATRRSSACPTTVTDAIGPAPSPATDLSPNFRACSSNDIDASGHTTDCRRQSSTTRRAWRDAAPDNARRARVQRASEGSMRTKSPKAHRC